MLSLESMRKDERRFFTKIRNINDHMAMATGMMINIQLMFAVFQGLC